MRVSINKKTGLMIESSSSSTPEVLIANAVEAGISEADIEVREVSEEEHAALIAARDAAGMTYAELRRREYPSVVDQLDMQFKDAMNGTTVWIDTISAIKSKYPKP